MKFDTGNNEMNHDEVNPVITIYDNLVYFILNHTSSFSVRVIFCFLIFLIMLSAHYLFMKKSSGCSIYTITEAFDPFLTITNFLRLNWISLLTSCFSGVQIISENGLVIGLVKIHTWDKFESFYWCYEPYRWIGADEKNIRCNLHLTLKPSSTLMNKRKTIDIEIPIVDKEMITKFFLTKFNR